MIFDFDTDPEAAISGKYDVCICGAGAAGITLAWFLSSSGKKVLLLEAGGKQYNQSSQNIYKGESIGLPYYLDVWRLRYFGGTTNHWTGRCRPFEREDFRERYVNGLPGWPVTFDEFDKYLNQAKDILGLPAENTFKATKGSVMESDIFEPEVFFKSTPVRFGEKYYDYLEKSSAVDVLLNANVVNISLAKNLKTVDKIDIRSYSGNQREISASRYILCMGAVENARLLLCSNSQLVTGIGNQTDLVGRCFMEHLNVVLGEFVAEPDNWENITAMVYFTNPSHATENDIALSVVNFGIAQKLRAHGGRTAELKKLFNKVSCAIGVSEQLQFIYKHWCLGEGRITTLCEQVPNKESRVFLSDEVDEIGLKKVILDWQITEQDKKSIRYIASEIAKEFARNNLGRVKLSPYILDPKIDIPIGAHAHQMGTTRMAVSHNDGVVDSNCMVFDTDNLFVAGSSIFPTGGGGNPTMPIVQLALRLGKHLISS